MRFRIWGFGLQNGDRTVARRFSYNIILYLGSCRFPSVNRMTIIITVLSGPSVYLILGKSWVVELCGVAVDHAAQHSRSQLVHQDLLVILNESNAPRS